MRIITSEMMNSWPSKELFGFYVETFTTLRDKKDEEHRKAIEFQLGEIVVAFRDKARIDQRVVIRYRDLLETLIKISENTKYDARTGFWQDVNKHYLENVLA